MARIGRTVLMYIVLAAMMIFIAGIDTWHLLGWF